MQDVDKATDWIAIGISALIGLSLWGLFLYEYLVLEPVGEANQYVFTGAVVMSLLALLTLYGYEKVSEALELSK